MLYLTIAVILALWFVPSLGLFVGNYLVAHSTTLAEMRKIRKERFDANYDSTPTLELRRQD